MNASRIGCRLILVFLVAICVVWSQVSDAAANDWDETSHDWDQMVEADGSGDVKASADEKWGYQAAPVAVPPGPVRKLLTVCLCGRCPGRLV